MSEEKHSLVKKKRLSPVYPVRQPLLISVQIYNDLWVPSQNGLLEECLHWHSHTSLVSSILKATGERPVPRCDPSQNGWFELLPQAHQ